MSTMFAEVINQERSLTDFYTTRPEYLRVDLRLSSLAELIDRAESGSPGPAPRDAAIGLFTNNDHAGSDVSLIGLLRKREKEKGSRGRDVGMRDVGMGSRGTG